MYPGTVQYKQGLLPEIVIILFYSPRSLIFQSTPRNHYKDFYRPEISISSQVKSRDFT